MRYCGRSGHKNNKYQVKSKMKMGNGMDRQIKRSSQNHMHTNTNMQLKFKVQTTYKFKVYDTHTTNFKINMLRELTMCGAEVKIQADCFFKCRRLPQYGKHNS